MLARELVDRRYPISHEKEAQLLQEMDHHLEGNRKTEEGTIIQDRDAQFRHVINEQVRPASAQRHPVIFRLRPRS